MKTAILEKIVRKIGKLSPVGMVRFLQQYETGRGDYSRERHQWLDQQDVESIAMRIFERRKKLG